MLDILGFTLHFSNYAEQSLPFSCFKHLATLPIAIATLGAILASIQSKTNRIGQERLTVF